MNPLYLQNNGFRFMKDLRHNNDAGQRYVCTYIDNGQRCFAKLWRMNSGTILEIGDHNDPATTAMSSNHLPTSSRMAASSSRQSSTEKTYLGQVESCDFSIAYLFGDPQLILQIRDIEEWHIDMTFQCTPMIPKSSLLLTVMIRRGAEVVPMLFVLCSEKSAGLFSNLWQWIGAKVPNVYSNLKTIVCDSDDALEHSIRASIPRAEIKRTWIIVVRAIHRRWNSLDLPKRGSALNKMLFYTSALPFVPPGMMERATTVIEGMFAAHEENHCQFREMS
ncbi:uncharacterized protein LOC141538391 [Cotesia typhae]|uniref:uncharacterized protein LOC141538391 n=1 Tax=Cotesia typhae TaxID=2053667 RepID=UPI003D69072D